MKYFISAVSAVVVSVVVGVLAQNISLPTPSNVVQCTNISITWQGGSPPFTLLFQNGDANGAILKTVPNIPSNTFIWDTDIQGPTQIGMTIRDTNGLQGQSGPFEINSNTDTSCLNDATSVTTSGTDSAASTPASSDSATSGSVTGSAPVTTGSSAPGSSATSGGSSAAATSGASSASGSSPASSGSPTSSSSSAAGSQTSASSAANIAVTGFSGLFSVLLAAFLA